MQKLALLIFSGLLLSCSQQLIDTNPSYFELVRPEITGDVAYETTAYVEQFWRLAGNSGFDSSIYYVARKLEAAGYVNEEVAKKSDRLTYRIEKRPLQKPTWEPLDAELTIVGNSSPILSFATNRNMVPVYATSTPEEGIKGEVVYVADPKSADWQNVKGKIVFAESDPGQVFEKAITVGGALGLLTYNNPAYLQPEKNATSIQFRSVGYQTEANAWCLALSFDAFSKLKAALAKGPTSVNMKIKTSIFPSTELTLVAEAAGSKVPYERLVFSAHVQEPGANDNASGVGVQLEMAVATASLLKKGAIDPGRTITFLWGDEIISTRRYIEDDSVRASHIKWGISLDMLGENTNLTGGTFLIEKMPDPSAIWTRGNDKHTE